MGYAPAGKTGVKISAPTKAVQSCRINNVMTATESEEDPCRLDIHFKFKVSRRQKKRITDLLRGEFPGIAKVGFTSDHDLKVVVKHNGHGCPRYEIANYAENGFQ